MNNLEIVNTVLPYLYFGLALVLEAFVFCKVKFRLDLSMMIISLAYLLSLFLRLPLFSDNGKGMNIVTGMSYVLIYAVLYYFIF